MKPVLVVASILMASPAWADAYKCVTPEGETIYQDRPCHGDIKGGKLNLPRENIDPEEARRALAIATKKIYVGMTANDVRRAWGNPASINRTLRGSGVHEQWVYRPFWSVKGNYVYLEDGIVTAIQN